MDNRKVELSETINKFDNMNEAWNSRAVRKLLAAENSDWIKRLADWKVFVTLTFRMDRYPDVAVSLYKKMITHLNKDLFGNNYTRIVGHSYFSYVYGIEYQRRDVIHFHFLTDQPIHYRLVHKIWNSWAGFAWIDTIENKDNVISYVSKYVVKGGELDYYKSKKEFIPEIYPYWWKETRNELPRRKSELLLLF